MNVEAFQQGDKLFSSKLGPRIPLTNVPVRFGQMSSSRLLLLRQWNSFPRKTPIPRTTSQSGLVTPCLLSERVPVRKFC